MHCDKWRLGLTRPSYAASQLHFHPEPDEERANIAAGQQVSPTSIANKYRQQVSPTSIANKYRSTGN